MDMDHTSLQTDSQPKLVVLVSGLADTSVVLVLHIYFFILSHFKKRYFVFIATFLLTLMTILFLLTGMQLAVSWHSLHSLSELDELLQWLWS